MIYLGSLFGFKKPQMMKTLPILFVALLALMAITGCNRCACCGPYTGTITCIKGIDTISRTVMPPRSIPQVNLKDSLAFYRNIGYTCIDNTGPFTLDGETCGPEAKKHAKALGYGCIDVPNPHDPCQP
ncbi:MAG: hypothetical protein JWO06_591 [Bacteroidota bacterium]|nr:hypothetical protein [Bacteroidota bacterium]